MSNIKKEMVKLTQITSLHVIRLVCRSVLFIAALVFYILEKLEILSTAVGQAALGVITLVFLGEMALRFFPSNHESMGCQKQFARNYSQGEFKESDIVAEKKKTGKQVALVASCWIALNAVVVGLYYAGIIDYGIMMLICLAYSVCDMICILFFCPFQSWMMKNRCCVTCRICNWDYAMMFTPLIFIGNPHGYLLCVAALALLVRWEITYARHPERFFEKTNSCLDCSNCKEKLCRHKKTIRKYLLEQKQRLFKASGK